jgi:uncharacterized protein YbaA (DUF1428 family)
MTYVDGFVAAVPTANRETYKEHAKAAAVVFKEHGALKVVECWEDDVPEGKLTSFPMAVKRKDDEAIVFSWILWPSRNVRDEGMKKVMADPRLQPDKNPILLTANVSSTAASKCLWRRERAARIGMAPRATSAAISGTAVQSTQTKGVDAHVQERRKIRLVRRDDERHQSR